MVEKATNEIYFEASTPGVVWQNNSIATVGAAELLAEDEQSRSMSNLLTPIQMKNPFVQINQNGSAGHKENLDNVPMAQ